MVLGGGNCKKIGKVKRNDAEKIEIFMKGM